MFLFSSSKMIARRARVKAEKKAAKDSKKKRAIEEVFKKPEPTAGSSWHQPEPVPGPSSSDDGASVADSSRSNGELAEDDGEPSAKKIKKSGNNFLDQKPKAGTSKKVSVQEDQSKSEIYKSLFSSHKSAQNKPTGHWITFDPRYN